MGVADGVHVVKCRCLYVDGAGAPDPTAGGALDDDNSWHLDEEQVQKLVKNYLSQGIYCNHNEHLSSIFDKVNFMEFLALMINYTLRCL